MTRAQRIVVVLVLVIALAIVIALLLPGNEQSNPTATSAPQPSASATRMSAEATKAPASTLEPGATGLFVEPDDGRAPVLDELANSKQSITLQIYLLSDRPIINAIKDAHDRGVDVRV